MTLLGEVGVVDNEVAYVYAYVVTIVELDIFWFIIRKVSLYWTVTREEIYSTNGSNICYLKSRKSCAIAENRMKIRKR